MRYRLTRSEVETFSRTGYLEESTAFPNGKLIYALKAAKGQDHLSADFTSSAITLFFPDTEKEVWFKSERVGYSDNMQLPDGSKLSLLIEKDFVCLDKVDEDQSDNYPNPNAVC